MTTERWALVPVEPDDYMLLEAALQLGQDDDVNGEIYEAMIRVSPGAALLAEVLAARDEYRQACEAGDLSMMLLVRHDLLAALDKLGPAAEGAT